MGTIAGDAQHAADRGDTRKFYKLTRRLGAFMPTPAPGVKLKDGTLANDDDEGLARWAEHFAALLGGKQVEKSEGFCCCEAWRRAEVAARQHSEAVAKILRRMPKTARCGTRRDRERDLDCGWKQVRRAIE